jgi:TrmH family RNA methyltransferase
MLSTNEFQRLTSIKVRKYRELHRLFLVEGIKQVSEGINSRIKCEIIVISTKVINTFSEILRLAKESNVRCEALNEKDFERISETVKSQGIIGFFRIPKDSGVNFTSNNLIYLDRINDPGNMGTIIRTADWFGYRNILISPGCVDIYNPKVVRSTMGSIFRMNFQQEVTVDELKLLRREGYRILTTELSGKSLNSILFGKKNVVIMSSESHGVLPELSAISDGSIKILGEEGAESLNVGVAMGIILNKIFELESSNNE